jgi:RHS repeat-associated protein
MTPYLFTDQEHDPETSLQYFGARYYDPWVGRFLEQDPQLVGLKPGITFNRIAGDGQNLNAYSYALNRPTIMVDVNGEAAWRVAVSVGRVIANGGRVGLEVKGIIDDVRTVTDSRASTGERVTAGISLATGIPGGWLKSVFKVGDKASDAKSTAKAATGASNAGEAATASSNAASGGGGVGSSGSSGGGGDSIGRGGPPRDPSTGNYTPSPSSEGAAHTTLGTRTGSDGEQYSQGATFDRNGKFAGRTDVTDHGRSDHSNPHFHPAAGPNKVEKGPGQPIPKDSHPLDGKL